MRPSPGSPVAHPDRVPLRKRAALALLLLLPAPTVGTAAALLLWPEAPIGRTLFAVTKFWTALLPVVWLLWIDRQSVRWSPARKGGFGVATLSGILIAALILATYHFALRHGFIQPNLIAEQASRTGLDQIQVYVMGAVYWITLNSLMEEYVWRWFVFRKFEQLMKAPLAVLATALGFTAHHVVALAAQFDWKITLLGSLGVFLGGLTWSGIYLRYRSVWPCYLSHAIVDAPIFWIGYDLIFRRAA